MKFNKLLLAMAVAVLIVLAACGGDDTSEPTTGEDIVEEDNFNKEGFPIVDEPITLHFMAGKPPTVSDNYNETTVWSTYNEMSNIDIDWELVPTEGLEEKRNLALASNNLPDVFYRGGMPADDLVKYGQQGVFVTLNDLIEEYMPNLTQVLEENPDIRKGITFPDGNIYAIPTIYDPEFPSLIIGSKLWINKEWLDQLGMDVPQTTDEYYEYLKAVKENDLNGNGDPDDEIPYGGTSITGLRQWLTGSFGIQTKGRKHAYIDIDPESGDLRFFPTSERYKELLEYLNKLFEEELIHQNIYTIDTNQSHSIGQEGLYGSVVNTSAETIYGEVGKDYVGMPALEGPHGDRIFTKVGSPLAHMGGFVITSENEHIPETLRWMDHFYSDEGTKLFFMGVEGETHKVLEDGSIDYIEEIKNNPDGLSLEQALRPHITWLGGGYPGIVKQDFFKGAESLPSSIEAAEAVEPYIIDEIWPSFTYTDEEVQAVAGVRADIRKYVNEMQDKFITGEVPLTEWDNYVEQVEKMGLDQYLEFEQKAIDRYNSN